MRVSPGSSSCFSVTQSPPLGLSSVIQSLSYIFSVPSPLPVFYLDFSMVHTRGGSRLRPRVRFSTPEGEAPAPVPAPVPSPVPEAVPEEPQGFRRYQTRMGPRAPSHVPQRRVRRARPSKRGPHIGPRQVIFLPASATTSHIGCRGDIIALVVTCLQDQEAVTRREPHSGECMVPPQRLSSGVILRRPSVEV